MDGKYGHLGDELLKERIKLIKPRLHVCGHVHAGYGVKELNGVMHVNANIMNDAYNLVNEPVVADIYELDILIRNQRLLIGGGDVG